MRLWLRRLLVVPPVLIGAAVLAYLVSHRAEPVRLPPDEIARPVRTIEVPVVAVAPRAVGYGEVEPGDVWEAVAQVSGRIVERHPDLERGAILTGDTVLLRIDPADYELEIARIEAEQAALEAESIELDLREDNTRASIAIEERALELGEAQLDRKARLATTGATSEVAVEQEERTVLAIRQALQQHRNQLALYPAQRRLVEARMRQLEVALSDARLDLERTAIRLPFDARISGVNVEITEFATVGQVLVTADGLARADIVARFPIARLRRLFVADTGGPITADRVPEILRSMRLRALVRLQAGDFVAEWRAEVDRISDTIDPKTRTAGVIVSVDDPIGQAIPGVRPPLVKNMFVEVELHGQPREALPVVPRAALREGVVHVVTDGDRLERRAVEVFDVQGDLALIGNGLEAGDRVVVSDLMPAIDGMLLTPVDDAELRARLLDEATGGEQAFSHKIR